MPPPMIEIQCYYCARRAADTHCNTVAYYIVISLKMLLAISRCCPDIGRRHDCWLQMLQHARQIHIHIRYQRFIEQIPLIIFIADFFDRALIITCFALILPTLEKMTILFIKIIKINNLFTLRAIFYCALYTLRYCYNLYAQSIVYVYFQIQNVIVSLFRPSR